MFQTLSTFLPELFLALSASLLLGFGLSKTNDRSVIVRYISVGVLVVFAFMGYVLDRPDGVSFSGLLFNNDFSDFLKAIIGLSAAAALMLSKNYFQKESLDRYEFSVLTLYAVLGMSIMVSANNLLAMYIGIEMQSLALYILAAFNRDSLRASEAGLKYFVLGALSSGLLLYGASLIYGFTGSLDFETIRASIALTGPTTGIIAGMVFLLCGLAFKISAAPFHMWTPDVYEGSPTPVTGFFAAAPKLAAMAIITRLLIVPFGDIIGQWQQVIVVLAVLSMVVGALGAIMQTNIKRLMAYSSIANMGYALVPLAAGTVAGVQGMLVFMTIYIITVIGVFAIILQMRLRNGMVEQVSDLSGLSKSNPGMAFGLTMLMVSLIGIPPWLGFFGKLFAFVPAVEAGLLWLVVVALVASVISAFYYLRIIKTMWFDEPNREFIRAPRTTRVIAIASILLVIPVLILPGLSGAALGLADSAAQALFAQ
ncbi:NADH-quinone oxidoreductase subunit N [Litorimonas cladophorae]|uniref:NADH-quinone oxidoreductase subunit N n=1 Tax=Litorimonas cladophorae TaxID=1220491 RepID=A0A918KC14_9PROT|nr:NADH-quinone oxidoreductase subunit NuoN [Litorimonas cladophorae]GGX57572.1 NADH-quinone oxidoreductase subunit N [Litorimonas cladophorae]